MRERQDSGFGKREQSQVSVSVELIWAQVSADPVPQKVLQPSRALPLIACVFVLLERERDFHTLVKQAWFCITLPQPSVSPSLAQTSSMAPYYYQEKIKSPDTNIWVSQWSPLSYASSFISFLLILFTGLISLFVVFCWWTPPDLLKCFHSASNDPFLFPSFLSRVVSYYFPDLWVFLEEHSLNQRL